jgi:cell wall-associated NlpC family hydrolase
MAIISKLIAMKAISLHSVVPVRTEAREGAEQSTQILFGELCTILEQIPRWNRVQLLSDGQEGWVDAKMIAPMNAAEEKRYGAALKSAAMVAMPMAYAVSENNGQTIPLTAGTRLTNYKDGRFEVLGVGFRIDPSMVLTAPREMNQENLLQTVRFFINIPYLWGGKNAMGMDCSGFTQVVMSLFGKSLLRNASEQVTQGKEVAKLENVQAGDLVFFDHEDGKISHVGIAIDAERVIHCSGRVKVEKLDETGIFSAEQGAYTHHLAAIRRI